MSNGFFYSNVLFGSDFGLILIAFFIVLVGEMIDWWCLVVVVVVLCFSMLFFVLFYVWVRFFSQMLNTVYIFS